MKKDNSIASFQSWITVLISLCFLAISSTAAAEIDYTGTYWGIQFSESNDEFDSDIDSAFDDEISRGHAKAKYGKMVSEYISWEGQLGLTTNSSENRGIITYGAYLRASKDLGDYRIYGLLGASGLHAYDDDLEDVTESGGSLGVGIEVFGSKTTAVTFEYLRMIDKSVDDGDFTFDTIGLGFTYYFVEDQSYFNKNRNKINSIRY